MEMARRPLLLAAALLLAFAGGPLGCATMVRSSHASVTLRHAPRDLVVLDESGRSVVLHDDGPWDAASGTGSKVAEIPWNTNKLTLQSGGQATQVEADSTLSFGYFIADYLLLVFPIVVDFATSKWRNFEDVDVPKAIAVARSAPVNNEVNGGLFGRVVASVPQKPPQREPDRSQQRQAAAVAAQQASQGQTLVSQAAPLQQQPTPGRRQPVINAGKLAVLDFKSYTDALKPEDVRYFTDVVRGSVLKTAPGMQVMTRENLLVLLQATGKDATQCEGECEVDTGRRIGADAVVSGEILKVGSRFKMSLKLHETREGRLLSTSVASGKSIDELDESAQSAASELLIPKQ